MFLSCKPCCKNASDPHEVKDSDAPSAVTDDNLGGGVVQSLPAAAGKADGAGSDNLEERPEEEVEGGARYKGQWKGNVWHGYGVLTRPDGSCYEGNFADGRAQGHGRFTAVNGNTYEGQWDQDRAHGHGKYIHEDGSTYEGDWYQDEKSGQGVESWADGSRYEGGFLHGIKHGVGSYKSSTGAIVFNGQFS